MRDSRQGFHILELLITLALAGLLVTLALPDLVRASARTRVRLAAGELVGTLRLARSAAVRYSCYVGVKFRPRADGTVTFTLYRDGDGDGVRSADIASGVDPPLGDERRLQHLSPRAGFGFPPGRAPRDPGDPGRRLDRLDDPVRFNRSDIASFGPLGSSTPGSLYVTDHRQHLAVVRVHGRSGKVRVLVYDPDEETWRRD